MKRREIIALGHQRGQEVVKLKDEMEWTFQEIGAHYGFTSQRAQQIYKAHKEREEGHGGTETHRG